jgi:1-phosphofructokinase family hexose kinase
VDRDQGTTRIVIAGPNLSLDRTIFLDRIEIGRVHRTHQTDVRGGGKGVNVARALACIRVRSHVVGMAGGLSGAAIVEMVKSEGLSISSIAVSGEARSCLTVLARHSATTVFNEPGPAVSASDVELFFQEVESRLESAAVFVCSGSWPPGAPDDSAARLIAVARDRGCFTIGDTSGEYLARALDEEPDVVKPNLSEARSVLGAPVDEMIDERRGALEAAADAGRELMARGAKAAVVTAGSAGAVLVRRGATEFYPACDVAVVNPVGAGDCLVAGMASTLAGGFALPEAVRRGVAMAAASCETIPAGVLDAARAEQIHQDC